VILNRIDTAYGCCILLMSFDRSTHKIKLGSETTDHQKTQPMNPEPNPASPESALETLMQQALAIIVVPTLSNDNMHNTKIERTRMLLCLLVQTLEMYFKDKGVSPVANYCTIAHESSERARATTALINETVSIIARADTNASIDMESLQRGSQESIASVFLELLGKHYRFLFLVADSGTPPILSLRKLFPDLSSRTRYLGIAGECFVYYPSAAYCDAIALPGIKT